MISKTSIRIVYRYCIKCLQDHLYFVGNLLTCFICFIHGLSKLMYLFTIDKNKTRVLQEILHMHSCQPSRINREAHGFGKFFRISHELDKSQGFSRNSRFFLKEIPKLYRYSVFYIPQLISVLSTFVFVAFRWC